MNMLSEQEIRIQVIKEIRGEEIHSEICPILIAENACLILDALDRDDKVPDIFYEISEEVIAEIELSHIGDRDQPEPYLF